VGEFLIDTKLLNEKLNTFLGCESKFADIASRVNFNPIAKRCPNNPGTAVPPRIQCVIEWSPSSGLFVKLSEYPSRAI
jgi:hypothetical protein